MLQSLYVRNYAIIEEVNIEFDGGFNVITGETGAGKSILLGALGLILGKRADTKVLYHQDEKCIVEARFRLDDKLIDRLVISENFDLEPHTIIRREISSSGKSRAFINDTPVTLADLKLLSSQIFDIHNQFDTLSITVMDYQRQVVDLYAGTKKELKNYQAVYHQYRACINEISQLIKLQSKGQQDLDYLTYQLEELESLDLDQINQKKLEDEFQSLSNSEEIQFTLQKFVNEVSEDEFCIENRLIELSRALSSINEMSSGLSQMDSDLTDIIDSLRDLSKTSQRLADEVEHDPGRVQELKETLEKLYSLQKKHQLDDITDLINLRDQLKTQTDSTLDLEATIKNKEAELVSIKKNLTLLSQELTQKRVSVFETISRKIEKMLISLAIPNGRLLIERKALEDYDPSGMDEIDFLFTANKGIDPQSIAGVASGGELSRLALAVKSLIAEKSQTPTMIFDEIDQGISGSVALQLSRILKNMSFSHQIICITHAPQVAATEGKHFFIKKEDTDKRTITTINELNYEGRINEIAKMLSSDPPPEAALSTAKELLVP